MLFYIFRLKISISGKMVTTGEKVEPYIGIDLRISVDLQEAREVVRKSELNQRVFAALLGFYEIADELDRTCRFNTNYYEISLKEIGALAEESDLEQLKETLKSFCKVGLLREDTNNYLHPMVVLHDYIEKTSGKYMSFNKYLDKLCKQ